MWCQIWCFFIKLLPDKFQSAKEESTKELRNRKLWYRNDNRLRIHLNTEVRQNNCDNNYNHREECKCYNFDNVITTIKWVNLKLGNGEVIRRENTSTLFLQSKLIDIALNQNTKLHKIKILLICSCFS